MIHEGERDHERFVSALLRRATSYEAELPHLSRVVIHGTAGFVPESEYDIACHAIAELRAWAESLMEENPQPELDLSGAAHLDVPKNWNGDRLFVESWKTVGDVVEYHILRDDGRDSSGYAVVQRYSALHRELLALDRYGRFFARF